MSSHREGDGAKEAAGEAGWDQTVQASKSMLSSVDACGGTCGGTQAFLGWQTSPPGIACHSSLPRCCSPWSPGTSPQRVRVRVIKKKKVIVKKRKKLASPSPLVTARPPMTTSPAGTIDLPEAQEPGTAPPGTLPRLQPLGHVGTNVTLAGPA